MRHPPGSTLFPYTTLFRSLGGESIAEVFRSLGGQIRQSWCGPCFGQGPDALSPGQRAITSFNRNWQNRMGFGGEGYLASPRSEEHTSELQSRLHLVCRLLL